MPKHLELSKEEREESKRFLTWLLADGVPPGTATVYASGAKRYIIFARDKAKDPTTQVVGDVHNEAAAVQDFADWLAKERSLEPGTAQGYASIVRPAIGVDWGRLEEIEALVVKQPKPWQARFGRVRHLYWEYLHSNGVDVPYHIPDKPCIAIYFIHNFQPWYTLKWMRNLTWENEDQIIQESGRYVFMDEFQALRDWGQPKSNLAPLVPDRPGSSTPMSETELRRAYDRGNQLFNAGHRINPDPPQQPAGPRPPVPKGGENPDGRRRKVARAE